MTDRAVPILLFVAAALAFAVGIWELPVLDRDEARFAQAVRQMVATGDYVDIRFHDGARHNKPAGIYWLQSIAVLIFGEAGIWVHRLVSVLAAAGATVALIWAGTPLVGRRAAVWAGLILATIWMLQAEARIAKTDATLLLTIVLAMGALARIWTDRAVSPWIVATFWTALAAGVLIKGPIILMPVGGAMVWLTIRERSPGWMSGLRPLFGLAWFVVLVAPWYLAIIIQTQGGFLMDSLVGDLTDKVTTTDEADGTPPGTYLVTFWLTFWPWGLLAPLAVLWAWARRHEAATAFLAGWIIPTWVAFELIPTKLLHYTLPTYPAIALICGAVLAGLADGSDRFRGWAAHIGAVLTGLAALGFAAAMVWAPMEYGNGIAPLAAGGAALAVALVLAAIVLIYRARASRGAMVLAAGGAVMAWTLFAVTLPSLDRLWITPRIEAAMAQHACLNGPVAMVGFQEPSTVFTFGRDTRLMDAATALEALEGGSVGAAWVPVEQIGALGLNPEGGVADLTEVRGTNYSNGDEVALRLLVPPGVPASASPCD